MTPTRFKQFGDCFAFPLDYYFGDGAMFTLRFSMVHAQSNEAEAETVGEGEAETAGDATGYRTCIKLPHL